MSTYERIEVDFGDDLRAWRDVEEAQHTASLTYKEDTPDFPTNLISFIFATLFSRSL